MDNFPKVEGGHTADTYASNVVLAESHSKICKTKRALDKASSMRQRIRGKKLHAEQFIVVEDNLYA